MVLLLAVAIWHVLRLRGAGAQRDAAAAAAVWALTLTAAAVLDFGLKVPSPLALLEWMFRGLTEVLRTF
jgi:hypothetical protein